LKIRTRGSKNLRGIEKLSSRPKNLGPVVLKTPENLLPRGLSAQLTTPEKVRHELYGALGIASTSASEKSATMMKSVTADADRKDVPDSFLEDPEGPVRRKREKRFKRKDVLLAPPVADAAQKDVPDSLLENPEDADRRTRDKRLIKRPNVFVQQLFENEQTSELPAFWFEGHVPLRKKQQFSNLYISPKRMVSNTLDLNESF